ncbi:MAG TPA: ABC transporter substrate-binding protein/permease [Stenomitos sp.]
MKKPVLVLLALLLFGLFGSAAMAAEAPPLRWGMDLEGGAPYEFTDPQNPERIVGFEKDIVDEIAKRLERPVTHVQTNWDSLIPALDRGSFDFAMAGIELTDEHKQGALFSRPYCVYQQQMVVRADDNHILVFDDLKGKKVGTLSGSAAHRMLEHLGGVDMKFYSDMYAVYQDLQLGRLDAVFLDLPVAAYYAHGNPKLRFVEPALGEGYYAIAMRKGDEALKRRIDAAIDGMLTDGSLERIMRHWNLWTPAQKKLVAFRDSQPVDTKQGPNWQRFLPMLLEGAWMTIKISVLAMALAMGVGLLLAVMRIYGPKPLSWLALTYVEVFRGTPLLIQLYLIYYGLPNLGIQLDAFVAGVIGLGLNYGANEAENYRAGIQAVPKGQSEASLALGMSRYQLLRYVILPQSFRVALPPVTNDFIALFKDSSLVSVITLVELTKAYGMLASATYDYIGLGLVTAGVYLAISYPASLFARWTEARLRRA